MAKKREVGKKAVHLTSRPKTCDLRHARAASCLGCWPSDTAQHDGACPYTPCTEPTHHQDWAKLYKRQIKQQWAILPS